MSILMHNFNKNNTPGDPPKHLLRQGQRSLEETGGKMEDIRLVHKEAKIMLSEEINIQQLNSLFKQ